MARNPWESDADVFVPQRGGSRVFRFLVAVGVVLTVTFVLGYYFPLLRAYQNLSARYQQDRTQAQANEQALTQAETALKQEQAARKKLESQQQAGDGSKKLDAERLATLRKALADKLDKSIKSGDAALVSGDGAGVVLAGKALFVPKKHELSAAGKGLVCDIAKLSASDPLRVKAVPDSGAAWSDAAEAATAVVQAAQEKCGVASSRLTLAARQEPASGSISGERVEIEFGN